MDSFLHKLIKERQDAIVRLEGVDASGRKCYALVQINAEGFKLLNEAYEQHKSLDVYSFGKVLNVGWYDEQTTLH